MVAYEIDPARLVDVLVEANAALFPFVVSRLFNSDGRRHCALAVFAQALLWTLQPLRRREVGLLARFPALFALARCMGAMCFIVYLAQVQRESSDGTKAARHAQPHLSAMVRRRELGAHELVVIKEFDASVPLVRRFELTAYELVVLKEENAPVVLVRRFELELTAYDLVVLKEVDAPVVLVRQCVLAAQELVVLKEENAPVVLVRRRVLGAYTFAVLKEVNLSVSKAVLCVGAGANSRRTSLPFSKNKMHP